MATTDLALHKAAQYLSSFGLQYLKKEADDSQSNMGWDSDNGSLISRKTADGQFLRLYVEDLKIEWVHGDESLSLSLVGRSHGEVCVWLHHIALRFGQDEYDFYLHYTLESGKMKVEDIYNEYDEDRAQVLIGIRNDAQSVCEDIADYYEMDTEVRVWPHHFDTGGYALMKGTEISIGYGMAIPDTIIDDYYFYASGYKDGKPVNTENLAQLKLGQWRQGEFNGATLPIGDNTQDDFALFLKDAITSLSKSSN